MKLSKRLVCSCLFLNFVIMLGGCQWLSFGSKEVTTADNSSAKENNIDSTETKRKEINANISNANVQIKNIGENQKKAARNILNLDENKAVKEADVAKAKNDCKADDKKKSADCQLLNSQDLENAKNNLENAKKELEDTPKQSQTQQSSSHDSNKNEASWGTIFLYLLGAIISLALICTLGFLAYRFINNINQERTMMQDGFKSGQKRHQELSHRIEQLEKTAKVQGEQFNRYDGLIQSLQKQVFESRSGQNYQRQAIFTPPVYKPEPQFPVSAEDYLSKVSREAITATSDYKTGLLIQDPNGQNEFLLVRDSALSSELMYAVPSVERFSNRNEYMTYYQNYYALENPAGGSVWIKSPTTVRRVEGGWKLETMGELEIR